VRSLSSHIAEIDSGILKLDATYIGEVEEKLPIIDMVRSRQSDDTTRQALEVAFKLGFRARDTIDTCIGGIIHGSAFSRDAGGLPDDGSIGLETELRYRGLPSVGQTVRSNPFLLAADLRHQRLTPPQYALATAIGQVSLELGQLQLNATPDISMTFVERFDGKYPISRDPESHGKMSSLQVARNLGAMGVKPSIIAYLQDGVPFTSEGVLVDNMGNIEHPDKTIPEDEVVFVTGWTSGFTRLKERGVAANIVMRSILRESLTETRLERIRKAGASCIFVSQESKDRIPVATDATVIPNGYDEDIFFYEARDIKKQIFFAGALVREKGIDHLLKLAQSMPDYDFVVAGSAEMYGRKSLQLDAPVNVRWLGEIAQAGIADQYRRSVASVFLTDPDRIFETFGKSGVEATLSGCPLVFIENGGLASNIVGHELTASIDRADIEAISQLIKRIEPKARNAELRRDLAVKASKKHLTWREVSARYIARGLQSVIETESTRLSTAA
jgi:hypothetical protein